MTALTITVRAAPPFRIDLAGVPLGQDMLRLPLGGAGQLGDVLQVTGDAGGGDVRVIGDAARLDGLAAGWSAGHLLVDGAIGHGAGMRMSGGTLEIRADAGDYAGAAMRGGRLTVAGNAGSHLGAALPEGGHGLAGGLIVVHGAAGDGAGGRMRRGTLIVHGAAGAEAAARMLAGTLIIGGALGPAPGVMMRRGTLIAGAPAAALPPTFRDGGMQDLTVLRLLGRALGSDLPAAMQHRFDRPARRFAGDMAALGKGEIILLGA